MHRKKCFVLLCLVTAKIRAILTENSETLDDKIVSEWRLMETSSDNPSGGDKEKNLTRLNKTLGKMGIDGWQFVLATANSIGCYFICTSEAQLQRLRQLYESSEMKRILEEIFSLLADETVDIDCLEWNAEEYEESVSVITHLNLPGEQLWCILSICVSR